MLIPEFWAEARRRHRSSSRQVTVRRFGWSNDSQAAAQAHADARAEEALQRAIEDHKGVVARREPKVPYNGAEGVPIREEVIDRTDRYVITRNSYGALCLNTPDALFADIDLAHKYYWGPALVTSLAVAVLSALATGSLIIGAAIGLVALALYAWWRAERVRQLMHSGVLASSELAKIQARAHQFPDWTIRVYCTPAGYRLLVINRVFEPHQADVIRFFRVFGVDRIYALMCQNQNCFRARLTAKPWRIGISHHLRPRPGVWPIPAELLPQRLAWVEQYQALAKDYAACKYVMTIGSGTVHEHVQPVLEIHDRLCQANSGLPLA